MGKLTFFPSAAAPTLAQIASWVGGTLGPGVDAGRVLREVAPIDAAGPEDLTFLDNPRYLAQLEGSRAGAVLIAERYAARAPAGTAIVVAQPYRAMADVMARIYPSAVRPGSGFATQGLSPAAHIHPGAHLEPGCVVDPGAVIGPGAQIGSGTTIASNAVIGPEVCIGRNGYVGAGASVFCALVGDRVIIHPGVHIGQDGFGFAMGPRGHLKVPQIGRVIIQDDVEIGAGTTIDRGANRDTIVGEGTKIDNLAQIGHNVVIGRHCVLVAQCGISGSTVLEDFVALGGQAGVAGHLRLGAGAQIAATSGVMNDIPAGETWGGAPAQPLRDLFREVAAVRKFVKSQGAKGGAT